MSQYEYVLMCCVLHNFPSALSLLHRNKNFPVSVFCDPFYSVLKLCKVLSRVLFTVLLNRGNCVLLCVVSRRVLASDASSTRSVGRNTWHLHLLAGAEKAAVCATTGAEIECLAGWTWVVASVVMISYDI